MSRLSLIYIISFILLGSIYQQDQAYLFKTKSYPVFPIFKTMEQKLNARFKDPEDVKLLMSYVCGGSKGLARPTKRAHQALNLQHLFSPSGLHLAAAYAWFLPLLPGRRAGRPSGRWRGFILRRIILIILYALPWGLPGYYAIKRICLLKIIYLLISPFKRPDYFWFFIGLMGLDFLVGTFKASPLSFAYSFLFLGAILATRHHAPWQQAAALLGGQIITSFYAGQAVTLTGQFFGQIITVLFTLIFPFFFIGFWGNYFFDWRWIQWPLHWWKALIAACGNMAEHLGSFYPSLNILLAMAFLLAGGRRYHQLKLVVLALLLICHSDPCFNQGRTRGWRAMPAATAQLVVEAPRNP